MKLRGAGEVLRISRKAKGLTIKEVTELVGVHVNTWSAWERGESYLNDNNFSHMQAIGKACNVLGITLDDLRAAAPDGATPSVMQLASSKGSKSLTDSLIDSLVASNVLEVRVSIANALRVHLASREEARQNP